ncbi:purine-nucleoside phosphorylase [Corynebacterium sp. 13CS0277]|uniref:purine-nucleoside phosphorylase n=1 Tax=Corynebacterium sp. 13CS0277 TaxID=2071994 RepID=UPI000D026089|nr:purine-nucleoside phosphorylase [Corynebacterium sp. 13CS0277]PRQ11345.1 purine-nucleoside phosphorylase [Corynebacterium sp. 13CS0277]
MSDPTYPSIFPLPAQEPTTAATSPRQPVLTVPLPQGAQPQDGHTHPAEPHTPEEVASAAAAALCQAAGVPRIDVGVVLGSGWKPAAEHLCTAGELRARIPAASLPGFLPPTAEGHGSDILVVELAADEQHLADGEAPAAGAADGRVIVALLTGRTHAYEGVPMWRTVHGVRTLAAAGAHTVVLTNAAGGIVDGMRVGEPVLIADHINCTGKTPLVGATFVNLVDAYSPRLRQRVQQLRPGTREAVYAMMPGPQYETPAEIRMLSIMGAGLVGMSTVYETIAARAAGLEVLGLSLVTNLAAGVTGEPLNHEEVLAAGAAAAADCGALLAKVVRGL